MEEKEVGSIVVVDQHNKLLGVVTSRDIELVDNLNELVRNVSTYLPSHSA